jgi:hypothetical protein
LKFRTHYIANLAILFILILGYFWLLIGAYYAYPNSEDFSLTVVARDSGIINSTTSVLRDYDGRYFTNILHGMNPLAWGWPEGHRLMPIVSILLCLASLYYFLRSFFSNWFSKQQALLLSAVVYLLHFCTVPSLVHELYWMVSAFVYLYPIPFLLIWISSSHHYLYTFREDGWKKRLMFLLSGLSVWAAIGLNEMFLPVNIVLLMTGGTYLFRNDRKLFLEFIPILIIAVASIAFFLICPGPWKRMSGEDPGGSLLFVTMRMARDAWNIGTNSVFNHTPLIFSIILGLWYANSHTGPISIIGFKKLALSCVAMLFLGLVSLIPFYAVMNEGYVPYRVHGSFVFSIHAAIVFLSVAGLSPLLKVTFPPAVITVLSIAAVMLLLTPLMSSKQRNMAYENNISLIKDLYLDGTLTRFQSEMENRFVKLQSIQDKPYLNRIVPVSPLSVSFLPVHNPPDLYPNRKDEFWNEAWEQYYKVNIVQLEEDSLFLRIDKNDK